MTCIIDGRLVMFRVPTLALFETLHPLSTSVINNGNKKEGKPEKMDGPDGDGRKLGRKRLATDAL